VDIHLLGSALLGSDHLWTRVKGSIPSQLSLPRIRPPVDPGPTSHQRRIQTRGPAPLLSSRGPGTAPCGWSGRPTPALRLVRGRGQ
jgi:hypothetical protein